MLPLFGHATFFDLKRLCYHFKSTQDTQEVFCNNTFIIL